MATLVSLIELKEFLGIGVDDTSSDKKLQIILTSLDAWMVEEFRQYGLQLKKKVDITELRDGESFSHIFTRLRPILQVQSVHVSPAGPNQVFDATTLVPDDQYVVYLEEGRIQLVGGELLFLTVATPRFAPERNVFSRGRQNIQVIYDAGFEPVPQDIRLATMASIDNFNTRAGKTGFKSEKLGDYTYTLRESEKGAEAGTSVPKDMVFELKLLLSHYLKPTFVTGSP